MSMTRSGYVPSPSEQEAMVRRYIAGQQEQTERLHPSPAELLRRDLEMNERGMRQVLGSSEDGREWAREAAAKEPAGSYAPEVPRAPWLTKAGGRVGRNLDREPVPPPEGWAARAARVQDDQDEEW
ncbi:hypothetical protein [Micromonospora sp. LH3U1]|uniref:hypothetical protein n=1 Tax=Micromonospora sp. LH3U1 TaxID=3018339 RepID=UPI0023496ACC|nr:hypothetical protein [Micromonospora sp. LH3U1]WCN80023.1 hypothetical protein PCA76_24150 [Micromonospora sp. LH3U1]